MNKREFQKLQKHWYKILQESGFKDIEVMIAGKMELKRSANAHFWEMDKVYFDIKADYFSLLAEKINDERTVYRNEVDKTIMRLRAEGLKIAEIHRALKQDGIYRAKCTVSDIIKRYEMQWEIRKYKYIKPEKKPKEKKKKVKKPYKCQHRLPPLNISEQEFDTWIKNLKSK